MNSGVYELKKYLLKVKDTQYQIEYPDVVEQNNFYTHGLIEKNDFVFDLSNFFGIRLGLTTDCQIELTVELDCVRNRSPKAEKHVYYSRTCYVAEEGKNEIILPIKDFSLPISQEYILKFVRGIRIISDKPIDIESVTLVKGSKIALECDIQSKSGKTGEQVFYKVRLYSCENKHQVVSLERKVYGWETLKVKSMPRKISLEPYEMREIEIAVTMTDRICPGGYEKQTIIATPNGCGDYSEKITFTTSKHLPHPHVIMDQEEFNQVKDKIKRSRWAKDTYDRWLDISMKWEVEKIDTTKDYLFTTKQAHDARGAATMYQLSGDRSLGLKVVLFLKELSDPINGYVRLPRAGNQELVHEGEFFKSTAIAYDIVHDFEELTVTDHENIEQVFRNAMRLFSDQLTRAEISNWTLAEICGGLYCACVLQDRKWMERFLYGVGGATEHLSKGVFADGWWFEASIGYNLLCAGLFSELSQVVKHFGINFKDIQVPANYATSVVAMDTLKDGLSYESWGINNKNYRNITMLWDSLINYYDYRGVVFGVNDSSETKVEGIASKLYDSRFDIAYYLYRKPEYASLMRNVDVQSRDLLFGVEELPEVEEEKVWNVSCYADNAGVAVLRSRKAGREDREQIQVGMKYGSHGGAHGHYDRVSMAGLMRYGRSLTGPENIWYSYHTFMYKFYVQNSVAHNMVTVDLKLQDPVEPRRLMFHTGELFQAIALENEGKWSHPPYGGWTVNNDSTFATRSWNEGRYVPIPERTPEYTMRSEYTEDILSRRLTVVTDDFVVNFDYMEGKEEHDYDCLYHLQGLKSTEKLSYVGHSEQLTSCSFSSAQFITDCDWYDMKESGKLTFEVEFSKDKNNGNQWVGRNRTGFNEYGAVNTDLYLAYPPQAEVIIGCDPENQTVNKQLFYQVEVDGKQVESGKFGAWILGKKQIDLDVEGKKEIKLKVRVKQVEFEEGIYLNMTKSIFWGNPQIVQKDGSVIDFTNLAITYENVDMGNGIGMDYEGGPVKIQAELFDKAVPAEPIDRQMESIITIDISGYDAKVFRGVIGGDYPVGDEEGRRRTIVYRQHAKNASFITVLEPVEKKHLIKNVKAEKEDLVQVDMIDGRSVFIQVQGLSNRANAEPCVQLREIQNGSIIREETTR